MQSCARLMSSGYFYPAADASLIPSGHRKSRIKMSDSSSYLVLIWMMILEGSSALSLFVEDEGNAASWIVGDI